MLSAEQQQHIRQIHLRTRRLVDGQFAGEYLSVFKGRGTEFAEVREYEPGDDVRTIDWKVTARMGVPYVKQYVEERELSVMLVVDASQSTHFGSTHVDKKTVIAELCAVVSMNALKHNNNVGLLVFDEGVRHFLSPGKDKHQTMRILHGLLANATTSRSTNLRGALEAMRQRISKRTLCLVVSDFLASDYEKALRVLHHQHDIIPVCVDDDADRICPHIGLVQLEDLETGSQVLVDTADDAFRAHYTHDRTAKVALRREVFRKLSINAIEVTTSRPFIIPLKRFFRQRELRRS